MGSTPARTLEPRRHKAGSPRVLYAHTLVNQTGPGQAPPVRQRGPGTSRDAPASPCAERCARDPAGGRAGPAQGVAMKLACPACVQTAARVTDQLEKPGSEVGRGAVLWQKSIPNGPMDGTKRMYEAPGKTLLTFDTEISHSSCGEMRPWHESLRMSSNSDVSMGEVWSMPGSRRPGRCRRRAARSSRDCARCDGRRCVAPGELE